MEQIFIVNRNKTSMSIEKISDGRHTLSITDSDGGICFDISRKLFDILKDELEWRKISGEK